MMPAPIFDWRTSLFFDALQRTFWHRLRYGR